MRSCRASIGSSVSGRGGGHSGDATPRWTPYQEAWLSRCSVLTCGTQSRNQGDLVADRPVAPLEADPRTGQPLSQDVQTRLLESARVTMALIRNFEGYRRRLAQA